MGGTRDSRGASRRALAIGVGAASVVIAATVLGAALPTTRGLFDDARVPADASGEERLYQTAIRIPVGTVAFEELAFRVVLLGLLCRRFSVAAAMTVDNALFALWHILPTLAAARANEIGDLGRVGLVIGSVVVTFGAGMVFRALRVGGRHLLAPAMLHLAYDTGYFFAWWVRSPPMDAIP